MKDLIKKWNSISLIKRIICGLIIGLVLGLVVPQASVISILGTMFVGALKGIAPLLVFFLVMSALCHMKSGQKTNLKFIIILYMVGNLVSAFVAVIACRLFPVTLTFTDTASATDITPPSGIAEVPTNLLNNLVKNPVDSIVNANYIGILFWAVIFGIALKHANKGTKDALENISDATATAVQWIINCAPFGIMGLIFSTISEQGLDALLSYGKLILVLVGSMAVVIFIINPVIVFIFTKQNPFPLVFTCLKGSFITEGPHRDYLNEFLAGIFPDSFARGEIYVNPETEESELCGTTASLAGIERFDYEGNMEGVSRGIRYDVALHALLLSLPGIPVLRSGDEVGQLNDYTYKADISKAADPRWLHNGRFNWALARNRADAETIQGRIFNSLEQLESIRASHPVFAPEVSAHTLETWEKALLALVRETSEEKLICIYNFSDQDKVAWINEQDGTYTDLLTGVQRDAQAVEIPAFGFIWLMHTK